MSDYWWHLTAAILALASTVWGCGLVVAAVYYGGSPAPYLRWTAGLFGRAVGGLFRIVGGVLGWVITRGWNLLLVPLRWFLHLLPSVAGYLWHRWRREIIWFLLGAATVSLAFWKFGTPW